MSRAVTDCIARLTCCLGLIASITIVAAVIVVAR